MFDCDSDDQLNDFISELDKNLNSSTEQINFKKFHGKYIVEKRPPTRIHRRKRTDGTGIDDKLRPRMGKTMSKITEIEQQQQAEVDTKMMSHSDPGKSFIRINETSPRNEINEVFLLPKTIL